MKTKQKAKQYFAGILLMAVLFLLAGKNNVLTVSADTVSDDTVSNNGVIFDKMVDPDTGEIIRVTIDTPQCLRFILFPNHDDAEEVSYNMGVYFSKNKYDQWPEYEEVIIPSSFTDAEQNETYPVTRISYIDPTKTKYDAKQEKTISHVKKIVISEGIRVIPEISDEETCEDIEFPDTIEWIKDRYQTDKGLLRHNEIDGYYDNVGENGLDNVQKVKKVVPSYVEKITPDADGNRYVGSVLVDHVYDAEDDTIVLRDDCTQIAHFAFCGNDAVKKVEVPSTVRRISGYAFAGCSSLTEVTGEACEIGAACFAGTALEEFPYALMADMKQIPWAAFAGCQAMTVDGERFSELSIENIATSAFAGATSVKEIVLPDSVQNIESFAFRGCTSLEEFTTGENSRLSHIGYDAFGYTCDGSMDQLVKIGDDENGNYAAYSKILAKRAAPIRRLVLPANAISSQAPGMMAGNRYLEEVVFYPAKEETRMIPYRMFAGCSALKEFALPDNVKEIAYQAFAGCLSLEKFVSTQDSKLQRLHYECFGWSDYSKDVDFVLRGYTSSDKQISKYGAPIKEISLICDAQAFNGYSISTGLFAGNKALETVEFLAKKNPNSTSIVFQTFMGCSSLKNILYTDGDTTIRALPDNVTNLEMASFADCDSLEEIAFTPASRLQDIGFGTFGWHDINTGVAFPISSWFDIGKRTVTKEGTPIREMTLPSTAHMGVALFAGNKVLEKVTYLKPESDGMIDGNSIEAQTFMDCIKLSEIIYRDGDKEEKIIPDNFSSIGYAAFAGCESLKDISFGEQSNMNVLDYSSFGFVPYGEIQPSGVESIQIPASVNNIAAGLFCGSESLKSVRFSDKPNGSDGYIDFMAFSNCPSLMSVEGLGNMKALYSRAFADDVALKEIDLTGVESIGFKAFENTALKEVVFPQSVCYVGENAFANCPKLRKIVVQSLMDWRNAQYNDSGWYQTIANMTGVFTGNNEAYCSLYDQSRNPVMSVQDYRERVGNTATVIEELEVEGILTDPEKGIYESAFDYSGYYDSYYKRNEYFAGYLPGLTKVTLKNVPRIGYGGFQGDYNLEILEETGKTADSVSENSTPGSCMEKIDSNAFYGCHKLDVDFERMTSLEEIGEKAFMCIQPTGGIGESGVMQSIILPLEEGDGLSEVCLPQGIKSVGESAFFGQRNAKKVILPASLTSCGNSAFAYMNQLEEITIGCDPRLLRSFNNAFWNERSSCLKKVTYDYEADGESFELTNGELYGLSETECVWNLNPKKIPNVCFMNNKKLKSFTIPDSVQVIERAAFMNTSAMAGIDIPVNVETIYPEAFRGSGIKKIFIYNKEVEIKEPSTAETNYMQKIAIPADVTIYGYTDSTAQAYATKHGNRFVSLDGKKIVTIDTNGGSDMAALQLETGRTVGELAEPVKTDYTFDGWYADKELTQEFDPDTAIDEDTTIYAKWKKTLPTGAPKEELMIAYNRMQTVGQVTLSENWKWDEQKEDVLLRPGKTVNVDAYYVGSDADQYAKTQVSVAITMKTESDPKTAPAIPSEEIGVPFSVKTVGDVSLPTDWIWKKADREKVLELGVATTATAIYAGEDKGIYNVESVTVTLTRTECEHDGETEVRGAKANSCKEEGYSGDVYCLKCGKMIEKGQVIKKKSHTPAEAVRENVVDANGKTEGSYDEVVYCSVCGEEISRKHIVVKTGHRDLKLPAAVGTVLTDAKSKADYIVTSADQTNPTVSYKKSNNAKAKSVTIPATITVDSITYKVTGIADNAFAKNKKLKKAVIGVTVEKIGKKAFYGCKNLKSITIKTTSLTAKNVGKNAFKGIYAKAKIKVPKAQKKNYEKILKKKGIGKEVKVK
ncbi:MAG: hypothetical protein E7294_11540 [Lachnospiraceae bacterium]|jgi:uncharacterized repeat protein (TIGR02543 family)|nr:hypothetical protein [Lachnospiraceae bacterium]